MGLEAFALSQSNDDRSESKDTLPSEMLRGDVLLERERVDARELTRKAVRSYTGRPEQEKKRQPSHKASSATLNKQTSKGGRGNLRRV